MGKFLVLVLLLVLSCVIVSPIHGQQTAPTTLPVFKHQGVMLDPKDLKYNPTGDIIVPNVIRSDRLEKPLGKFYLYYAPHDAPGGICLAYADKPEGPWKEYDANPLIKRDWPPHYKVSHVSGPHAIWIEEEKKLFLYYHGENDVTRLASSTDGVHFQYEGAPVTTKMFDDINEASYARIFRHTIPGKDNRFIMLLMGNNKGTRRIYLAWSKDGRAWESRRTPLLDPPPGTGQVAQAWLFPWHEKLYLIFHAHEAKQVQSADLHVAEIDAAMEKPRYIGLFYPRTSISPDNAAQMSPCLIENGGTLYMFTNVGPRLKQKIALATAPAPSPPATSPASSQPDAPRRVHVIIKGEVQGVGFRSFTEDRAANLHLTGWVSNRPDGSVEAVVEGPSEAVEQLLKVLRRGPVTARVESVDVKDESFTGEFKRFTIRH